MSGQTEFGRVQGAFAEAARWFEETSRAAIDAVGPDAVALGVWTVRDLVGHTSRALTTVEGYLQPGSSWTPTATTSDYYEAVRRGRADPDAVAERGREAGRGLGEEPAATVSDIVARVVPVIGAQDPEAVVVTPAGAFTLAAYLPTRVFELVVHTGDLGAAAGLASDAPASSARVALDVLGLLVAGSAPSDAMPLLRALTGRGALPSGVSLL